MADLDNNQTTPTGLPEKDWFTLEEIARRWNCPIADLLHYGSRGMLEICAFKPNDEHCEYRPMGIPETERGWHVEVTFSHSEEDMPLFALNSADIKKLELEGQCYVEGGAFGIFRVTFYPYVRSPDGHAKPILIYASKTFVTKRERDFFEKEHRIGAHAGTMPDQGEPIDNRQPWETVAREIAEERDPRHQAPSLPALALEVHQELKKRGVSNRNRKTPESTTIEREILRGWKANR